MLYADCVFDFKEYSRSYLKVKDKVGKIVPFHMNVAQEYIHSRLEEQKRLTGMVRAEILKGRQQGCSTYVEARFFHRVVTSFGKKAFILTHEQKATDNLFSMTERYYQNVPEKMRPVLGASNAKELIFSGLDGGFSVATAGSKGTGRSSTAQLFHGSEVAYWPNADTHLAGIMQTVPLEEDTEIIFESTANGIGDTFHSIWQQGESGDGGWQSIFVPWFWQHEYRHENVQLQAEDREYGELFGLDEQQMMWRRYKIGELGGDIRLFMREYPSTPAEAFSVSDDESLIEGSYVIKARKSEAKAEGAKIIGVDPARFGSDKTVITIRQGRCAEIIARLSNKDNMEVAGAVLNAIRKYNPRAVFIDVGGLGAGVIDRLRELGYGNIVHGINFGSKPIDGKKYYNKRAEMWGLMKNWLYEPPVQIPDDDDLEIDLCGLHYSFDSLGRLKLETKEDAKKRGIKSPDAGDSLALTFAFPVSSYSEVIYDKNDSWSNTVPGMGY